MAEQKSISLSTAESAATSVRVAAIRGDSVVLTYSSLPGNDPGSYGNFVAVWEDAVIPYSKPPLQKISIQGNARRGSVAVGNLKPETSEYIFGYAVGPQVADVCSYAYIDPNDPSREFSAALIILVVTPDTVALRYSFPSGFDPAQNGASVALWRGATGSYRQPPIAQKAITANASTGDVAMSNVQILFGETYTAALLASRSRTSLAAWVTFTIG
ncbi:MAG TPA: hypothetical protein VGN90_15150 [Pyrinomonadaceae bacterium]|jgi:hypothetical protein|nr:hypothetical protein [Pyrinomonadaceae bacterium]